MGQISQFLRRTSDGIAHWCPGCCEIHCLAVMKPNAMGGRWDWNGNIVEPTFSPSIHIVVPGDKPRSKPLLVCHYYLQEGMLSFLNDCTHALKGIKMHLPPLPPYLRDALL